MEQVYFPGLAQRWGLLRKYHSRKRFVHRLLTPRRDSGHGARVLHGGLMTLILLNVAALVLGSVASIEDRFADQLAAFEQLSVFVFSVEYVLRVWSCTVERRYRGSVAGRLRFMLTPLALVDLLAVAPFYLESFDFDLRFLWSLRLLRIFRLFKLGRYSRAYGIIFRVLQAKREYLSVSLLFVVTLTLVASCLMYQIEHDAQPEVFSSIPATLWWAVITLTTVGYGDVYPATVGGKILSSILAMLGIGLFALPAGIVASGFLEELDGKRKRCKCPHCKKEFELED